MNARVVSIVLLAMALLGVYLPNSAATVGRPEKRLATFPVDFEGWKGTDDPFDAKVMKVVDTDDDLHRLYRDGDRFLWLYIGYYGTRKGGRTGHLPHHCYPASGYRIVALGKVDVRNGDGGQRSVNHIVLEREGKLTSTLYWIHSGEHQILTGGWTMNVTRIRRRLTTGRDDGALVRISGPVFGTVEETVKQQAAFAERFLEAIPQHWPVEEKA